MGTLWPTAAADTSSSLASSLGDTSTNVKVNVLHGLSLLSMLVNITIQLYFVLAFQLL
jgi:hypothetical protein